MVSNLRIWCNFFIIDWNWNNWSCPYQINYGYNMRIDLNSLFGLSSNILIIDIFSRLLIGGNNGYGCSLWWRSDDEWFDLFGWDVWVLLDECIYRWGWGWVGLFDEVDLVGYYYILVVYLGLGEDCWFYFRWDSWNWDGLDSIRCAVEDTYKLLFAFCCFNNNTVLIDITLISLDLCRHNRGSFYLIWSDYTLEANITLNCSTDLTLRNDYSSNRWNGVGSWANG